MIKTEKKFRTSKWVNGLFGCALAFAMTMSGIAYADAWQDENWESENYAEESAEMDEAAILAEEKAQVEAERAQFQVKGILEMSEDELFEKGYSEMAAAEKSLNEAKKSFYADKDMLVASNYADDAQKHLFNVTALMGAFKGRNGDPGNQIEPYVERSKAAYVELNDLRAAISRNRERVALQQKIQYTNSAIDNAERKYQDALNSVQNASYDYNEAMLDQAERALNDAMEQLNEAVVILEANAEGNEKVAAMINDCESVREGIHIQRAKIYRMRGEKDPANGVEYLDKAIAELNEARRIKWGYVDSVPVNVENIDAEKQAYEAIRDDFRLRERTSLDVLIPEMADRDFEIRVLLESGHKNLMYQRFNQARDNFERVLLEDPFNLTAMRYLRKLDAELTRISKERRDQVLDNRMAEVTWKWAEPVTPLISNPIDVDNSVVVSKNDGKQAIDRILDEVTIPSVNYDATITEIIEELLPLDIKNNDPQHEDLNILLVLDDSVNPEGFSIRTQRLAQLIANTAALAGGGDGGQGGGGGGSGSTGMIAGSGSSSSGGDNVGTQFGGSYGNQYGSQYGANLYGDVSMNDINSLTESQNVRHTTFDNPIQLVLRNVTPREVLRYLSFKTAMDVTVDDHAVIISNPATVGFINPLETRFYNVSPGLFEIKATMSKMDGISNYSTDSDDEEEDEEDEEDNEDGEGGSSTIYDYFVNVEGLFYDMGVSSYNPFKITFDQRLSKLIVVADADTHEKIRTVMDELNQTPPQISIETKFVEVSQTNIDTLGFEWTFEGGGVSYSPASSSGGSHVDHTLVTDGGATRSGKYQIGVGSQSNGGDVDISNALRWASDIFGNTALNDSLASVYTIMGNYAFSTVIHALEQESQNDVLNCPRVTTMSGRTAQLAVVETRYMATDWTSTSSTTTMNDGQSSTGTTYAQPTLEKQDLGVTVDVTPIVDVDMQSIELSLRPKVLELVGYDTSFSNGFDPMPLPVLSNRQVETTVIVYDSSTLVLGGLIQDKLQKFEDKIPFLGSIPLLGRLFTSSGEKSEKINLMIFVTPRLVKPDGQPLRPTQLRGLPDFGH